MAESTFGLLVDSVKMLYTFYKNHRDSKRELQEVEDFLKDLSANSPILNAKNRTLKSVQNTLRGKLESATEQVKELSSRNSNFLHSDKTLRKIQGVRQQVKDAGQEARDKMHVHQITLAEGNLELAEDVRKRLIEFRNRTPKNAAHTPAKQNDQHPKPHPSKPKGISKIPPPRSKSTPTKARPPSKASPSPKPGVVIDKTTRTDKTVELYVPMDSDKQARDVVEKLKGFPGVKNVISDQTSKKVSVVPLKGVTLNTDQLLQRAKLENKFVEPTLWSKRPR